MWTSTGSSDLNGSDLNGSGVSGSGRAARLAGLAGPGSRTGLAGKRGQGDGVGGHRQDVLGDELAQVRIPGRGARNSFPAAWPSYPVCRSTTSGPSSAQYAPVPPYGMPTLPGLTNRRRSASRSNGIWVWPSTTVGSALSANAALYRSI